ncbi:hypothetical protein [Staphylospora marina]|uniref:hypothetical protein n=1 Tax=Staphylospora marina TaxID=2490858 RepID=UPI000F5BD2FA|nr:hypothetical protein [Staphylospora marina]
MRFTLEEMNLLSEWLEKEEARLHQTPEEGRERNLQMIGRLQRKFRDLQAELEPAEQEWLVSLLAEERSHIHGNAPEAMERIRRKLIH